MPPSIKKPDYPKIVKHLIGWLAINIFFGLLPLFLAFCLRLEINKQKILTECVVSFFCIAMMGSVICDYNISKYKPAKYEQMFIFATPLLLLIVMNPIYTKVQLLNPTNDDVMVLERLQLIAIIVSTIYCTLFKVLMFAKEFKK
jgi:hypothetical protein